MRVLERSVYRGPHVYGRLPMIRMRLDLQDLADAPTTSLEGFADRLLGLLPGLAEHGCSRGRPGGFVERMREGTWLGHVVEHVALELQKAAGAPVSRGKTRSVKRQPGVYDVLFAYASEGVGLAAGRLALELVAGLLPAGRGAVEGLERVAAAVERAPGEAIPGIAALRRLVVTASLGPSTLALVDEARRRGIPVERLDGQSLVRAGWGSRQHQFRASILDTTSHLAVVLAGDKQRTKLALQAAGVPVPRGIVTRSADEAVAFAARAGSAVVTKPLNGNHGRGVTTGLSDERAVRDGFALARAISRDVVVEQHLGGRDHRVLVVGGSVVAVAERVPAHVVGDGISSISELIASLNSDPRRGDGHHDVLTKVVVDDALVTVLADRGLALTDVPARGDLVVLRQTANLSTGGEAIDRTDEIHPEVRAAAEGAALAVGLDVAGIDLLTGDIALPLSDTGGGVVEVNAAPGLRMHTHPSSGASRPVAAAVIDVLYPPGSRSRIPVVSVTGTNGKSTTVRMIAHILAQTGATVGMTTTSGVYIGGARISEGDSSGPRSARVVLGDRQVDAAVLETARGGLLREGLAYDRADVGVVLNVSADHLGLKGIDSLHDLARVKGVIARRVRRRGVTVLNADDPHTRRMIRIAGGRPALFSVRPRAELEPEPGVALLATLEPGAGGGALTIHDGSSEVRLLSAAEIPATLGGAAEFNTANALAAALACYARGVAPATIAGALRSFEGTFEQNPGRLNITRAPGFTTIVDYAHNPAALKALGGLIGRIRADHDRVIGVISTPGDRRDADILELGALSAQIFDDVVFRELPDGRGRETGGVVSLLSEAATAAGMDGSRIRRVMDEQEAMDTALRMAGPRDLVVLTVSAVEAVWAQVGAFAGEA